MTQPTNSRVATIQGTEARVLDLLTRYREAATEARRRIGADTRLTTEGQAAALREAYAGIRQRYTAELQSIADAAHEAANALQNAADAGLPTGATGVEGILTRQAWWARSRSLFDVGQRVQDVIASATDPEQLISLREELPTAARAGIVEISADPDTINALVNRRLAEVAGPAVAQAFDDAITGQIMMAGLAPTLNYAAAEISGQAREGTGLASAAAGLVARQQALLRLRPAQQDVPISGGGA